MRYLAIDLGDRRTGLAIADDETRIASPLAVVARPPGPELIAAIRTAAEENGAGALVVGLPLNMDGTEGPAARAARVFGARLARALDRPVYYQDERLTSYAADEAMSRTGRTRAQKKRLRDALAAAEILRDFLDQ